MELRQYAGLSPSQRLSLLLGLLGSDSLASDLVQQVAPFLSRLGGIGSSGGSSGGSEHAAVDPQIVLRQVRLLQGRCLSEAVHCTCCMCCCIRMPVWAPAPLPPRTVPVHFPCPHRHWSRRRRGGCPGWFAWCSARHASDACSPAPPSWPKPRLRAATPARYGAAFCSEMLAASLLAFSHAPLPSPAAAPSACAAHLPTCLPPTDRPLPQATDAWELLTSMLNVARDSVQSDAQLAPEQRQASQDALEMVGWQGRAGRGLRSC